MDKIKDLLNEEIQRQFKDLASFAPGSKEKDMAVDTLTKLYKLKIEESKMENEEDARIFDGISKSEEKAERIKDQYGLEAAGLVLPLLFYATWMKKGFKFEKTGTFVSTTFRNLFSRFKPTR